MNSREKKSVPELGTSKAECSARAANTSGSSTERGQLCVLSNTKECVGESNGGQADELEIFVNPEECARFERDDRLDACALPPKGDWVAVVDENLGLRQRAQPNVKPL